MKKLLSLLLSLTLVFTLAVPALAFDDVGGIDEEFSDALNVMVSLGAIEGMGDGTFAPQGSFTREQATKIVAYMKLGKAAADALTADGEATFADVDESRWSAPYVEYCVNAGIIEGLGDGTFAPADKLTGHAWGKMMLCAMGYNADIEGFNGANWELAVEKKSDALGASLNDAVLNREDAVSVACKALFVPQVRYGEDGKAAPYQNAEAGVNATLGNTVHAGHFQQTPVKVILSGEKHTIKDVLAKAPPEKGAQISINGGAPANLNLNAGETVLVSSGGGKTIDPEVLERILSDVIDPAVASELRNMNAEQLEAYFEGDVPEGLIVTTPGTIGAYTVPSDYIGAGAAFERGGCDIQIFDKNANGQADFYAVVKAAEKPAD